MSSENSYADEEVASGYRYLSGYKKPKDIRVQTAILRQVFPGLRAADETLAARPVPAGAEGWFAIPRWQAIAPTYGEATGEVLAKIREFRLDKFGNWRDGQLGPDYHKQSARTENMSQTLSDEQKGHDILVVAAQFGVRHRGRSVRRAREVMQVQEFGLGAFAVGIMLLTHPERLMSEDDLFINCAGDECAPVAGGDFWGAPIFCFGGGRVSFFALWFGGAPDHQGSASAFLPCKDSSGMV
jgi:hypothetical protein